MGESSASGRRRDANQSQGRRHKTRGLQPRELPAWVEVAVDVLLDEAAVDNPSVKVRSLTRAVDRDYTLRGEISKELRRLLLDDQPDLNLASFRIAERLGEFRQESGIRNCDLALLAAYEDSPPCPPHILDETP